MLVIIGFIVVLLSIFGGFALQGGHLGALFQPTELLMIGGAAGILGHLDICDGAIISAMTLVTKSITQPGTYTSSMPLMKHEDWLRNAVHLRRLDVMADAIKNKGDPK